MNYVVRDSSAAYIIYHEEHEDHEGKYSHILEPIRQIKHGLIIFEA